jgi:hypothetical protein
MTLTLAVEMLQRLSFISVSDPRQNDDGSRRIAARFVGSDGRDVHFGQGTPSRQKVRKVFERFGLCSDFGLPADAFPSGLAAGWLPARLINRHLLSSTGRWECGALGSNAHAGDELQEWALRR